MYVSINVTEAKMPEMLSYLEQNNTHPLSSSLVKFLLSNLVNDTKLNTKLCDLIANDINNSTYSLGGLSSNC